MGESQERRVEGPSAGGLLAARVGGGCPLTDLPSLESEHLQVPAGYSADPWSWTRGMRRDLDYNPCSFMMTM